jgi:hypothetical protein
MMVKNAQEGFEFEGYCYLKDAAGNYKRKYLVLIGCDLLCFKSAQLDKKVFMHNLRNVFFD